MTTHVLSATSLIGDGVINSAGDDLGKITELMIDLTAGRVAYAVLSFGGFLGLGDKLFAVPWEALTVDTNRKKFVFNIEKDRLENAPGFDQNHWPDMADPRWGQEIHTYYGYEPYWERM
jgi:sporulation protein YlmC with PRC-barrel domain